MLDIRLNKTLKITIFRQCFKYFKVIHYIQALTKKCSSKVGKFDVEPISLAEKRRTSRFWIHKLEPCNFYSEQKDSGTSSMAKAKPAQFVEVFIKIALFKFRKKGQDKQENFQRRNFYLRLCPEKGTLLTFVDELQNWPIGFEDCSHVLQFIRKIERLTLESQKTPVCTFRVFFFSKDDFWEDEWQKFERIIYLNERIFNLIWICCVV